MEDDKMKAKRAEMLAEARKGRKKAGLIELYSGALAAALAAMAAMAPGVIFGETKQAPAKPTRPRKPRKKALEAPKQGRQAVGQVWRFMRPYASLPPRRAGEGRPADTYRCARRNKAKLVRLATRKEQMQGAAQ